MAPENLPSVMSATESLKPMPANTKLSVTQGSGSASNVPCSAGSCFGMDQIPGTVLWADFGPGTDGGIVVGKLGTAMVTRDEIVNDLKSDE